MTLCYSAPTTYRGYDKRDAIRGAIPENWQIIPEAKSSNDRIEQKIVHDTRTRRLVLKQFRKLVSMIFHLKQFSFFLFPFSNEYTITVQKLASNEHSMFYSISRREYSWLRFLTVSFC